MAFSPWEVLFLGTCCCWTLASGGTSSAMVGLLATSRSLSPSSWHSNKTGSSASASRVGASSASWSLPITSSFLPSSAPSFSTTTESTSSYLKNHATSYSLPTVNAGNKDASHKLSSANLVYNGSPSSQAAYAAATYYATSSTSTTSTTTTTPRPFSYNLPYSPIDHYFDRNTAGSSGSKAATFKHGTSSFKQPSSGGGGYYTSEDYDDDEDDRDAVDTHRDRYHLTRNDALKPLDYDSAETSPPTYVKTKYGYTARNPLLMTSESSKVLTGVSRGDVDKGASSGGGGNRLGDKDVGDKTYATASSDHYDYKGGFVAADYSDDFGFPDLDPHYLPYLHHRRKHHSGKGPLALLLGLLPLGLLMAALVPSVINLPVAAVGAVGAAGRRRREAPSYRNPILDSIAKFGVNSLEDPLCLQRIFCEVTAQGKKPDSLPVQKVFYTLSALVNDLWAERLGLKLLFGAVKKGQCDVFRCKAAKPTKRGKHRSSKTKNKDAVAKKASKE